MVYTRERLLKAVQDAGRDGQPFTLGAVREQLGLKTRNERELKRFRSRFRECCKGLGTSIEKLGPNTYRLNKPAGAPARPEPRPTASVVPTAARPEPRPTASIAPSAARPLVAAPVSEQRGGLGSRLWALVDRMRSGRDAVPTVAPADNSAATALSRLAIDLQPKATNFQYQSVDGEIRVRVARR